jgi:hypothetical protein
MIRIESGDEMRIKPIQSKPKLNKGSQAGVYYLTDSQTPTFTCDPFFLFPNTNERR